MVEDDSLFCDHAPNPDNADGYGKKIDGNHLIKLKKLVVPGCERKRNNDEEGVEEPYEVSSHSQRLTNSPEFVQ